MDVIRTGDGKHYIVNTPSVLPPGPGVKCLKTDLAKQNAQKAGWGQYQLTVRAYERLKQIL